MNLIYEKHTPFTFTITLSTDRVLDIILAESAWRAKHAPFVFLLTAERAWATMWKPRTGTPPSPTRIWSSCWASGTTRAQRSRRPCTMPWPMRLPIMCWPHSMAPTTPITAWPPGVHGRVPSCCWRPEADAASPYSLQLSVCCATRCIKIVKKTTLFIKLVNENLLSLP